VTRDIFDLPGDYCMEEGAPASPKAAVAFGDPLPPGPYAVGLTHSPRGDSRPFTLVCGDGRAIAGHIESRACADALAEAMNLRHPAKS
jgi:hypothetical protein